MPHSIDTLLVHLKDTLKEFGVNEETSADIGGNAINQILDAIYHANPNTLGQNYGSSLDFRYAALEQGLLYEQWLRPQLGMPPVRSFPEDDEIIEGLANHLSDIVLSISVLKDELRLDPSGLWSRTGFSEVDASIARASKYLRQFVEDNQQPAAEALPPTRFEREPVL